MAFEASSEGKFLIAPLLIGDKREQLSSEMKGVHRLQGTDVLKTNSMRRRAVLGDAS